MPAQEHQKDWYNDGERKNPLETNQRQSVHITGPSKASFELFLFDESST